MEGKVVLIITHHRRLLVMKQMTKESKDKGNNLSIKTCLDSKWKKRRQKKKLSKENAWRTT
jgi:hypothetical protein